MKTSPPLIAIALAFVGTNTIAADLAPGDIIIVTATRTEIPLSDATVPVTVITREDGVRINPGTLGGAAIQHISPEIIERVEIVKGARSALFGTDAIGGVINIITRRADRAFFEAGAGAGSFDSTSGFLSGGNHGENGEFGIALDWQDTAGYAPRTDSDIVRGYDNLSANLYGSRRFGHNEISVRHWQTGGTVEYLDFFLSPVDQDFENSTTAVELNTRVGNSGTSKLIASFMQDDITQNQSDDFVKSDRLTLDWQYSQAFRNHTLTGGLFLADENAQSLSFGSGFDEDTGVRAVFIQDQWSAGRHQTFTALRLTDHETFGRHTTWNAEYAFDISDSWTLNAGLGHAFHAPDATDRFGFGGNPELEPEQADEAQLGLRFAPGTGHSVNLEIYANDIDDLIEFDLQTFALRNIAEAEIRGAQFGYEYRGDRFVINAEVTRQRAEDVLTGERLLRRAEETASVSYAQDVGIHRFGLSVLASGDREDFGGVKLPGYVLANLTAQFSMGNAWAIHARLENLLDTDYETAAGFRMQERSGFVELKYRWN